MPDQLDKSKHKRKMLHDVEVTHVSLVDRPANRTPFKFIKSENGNAKEGEFPMNIHLKNLFGSRGPEVASVIAKSEDAAKAAAEILLPEGSTVTITKNEDVYVARVEGDEASADERLIHAGNEVGLAYTVRGLRKELVLYDMDGEDDFDDSVKREGFVPSLMIGMDALYSQIAKAASSDEITSQEDFRKAVEQSISAFQKYVDSLISELPERAFKFEKSLVAVAPQEIGGLGMAEAGVISAKAVGTFFPDVDVADATEEPQESTSATESATDGDTESVVASDTSDDVTPAGDAENGAAAASADDGKPDNLEELPKGTPEGPTAADFEATMSAALEGLTKQIGETITKEIGAVSEKVAGLSERLDAQDEAVSKLTKAVGGKVASEGEADHEDNVVSLRKTGSDGEPPLLDTGYSV